MKKAKKNIVIILVIAGIAIAGFFGYKKYVKENAQQS